MNPTEIESGKSYRGADGVVRNVLGLFSYDYGEEKEELQVQYDVDNLGFLTMPLDEFAARAKEESK